MGKERNGGEGAGSQNLGGDRFVEDEAADDMGVCGVRRWRARVVLFWYGGEGLDDEALPGECRAGGGRGGKGWQWGVSKVSRRKCGAEREKESRAMSDNRFEGVGQGWIDDIKSR